MSRASRRERRESAKRANNPRLSNNVPINKHHSTAESKQERLTRMQELYIQNKRSGEKS